jgi:hypothetical protein
LGNIFKAILLAGLCLFAARSDAVSFTKPPSADTSLIEVAPTNNNGGQAWVLSGRTQNGTRNRGLFKFDLTDIPTNAVISSVAFVVEVTQVPSAGQSNSTFGLHRMLRPWGEGDKFATNSGTFGQGMPASPGEATWLHSFYPTNAWSAPGGAVGVDFSSIESSFQFIAGLGSYRFDFTPELAADAQDWVNNPQSNYGWMLLCDDEGTIFTARRFGSREDTNAAPSLQIEYLVTPRIDAANRVDNRFELHFTARAGQTYAVQYSNFLSPSNTWSTLTNISAPSETTNLVITDFTSVGQRFYRLSTQ